MGGGSHPTGPPAAMNHPSRLPVSAYRSFAATLDPDSSRESRLDAVRAQLDRLGPAGLNDFLASAAACRLQRKRNAWNERFQASGYDQALFECLADTLGYSANREAMQTLAQRAPLAFIREGNAEALLFGAAGFLVPVLAETCDADTRACHKSLWSGWWTGREHIEESPVPQPRWTTRAVRPANHPQRRVAALALVVHQWKAFSALCRTTTAHSLIRLMTSLEHPYWCHHFSLPSARFGKPVALIGRDRALDFIVNHVAAIDDSPESWPAYLSLPASAPSAGSSSTAQSLIGDVKHVHTLLRKAFAQQAFLQIRQDCGC